MNDKQVIMQNEKPQSSLAIQEQVNTIQHVMRDIMQKDVHFGVIPGTKTPSLYKPGAEKIMMTFRLSAEPEVTDMSNDDEIHYQVKVKLVSPSGVVVGFGIGECSSNEEKYKWRGVVCSEEFDEAPATRKREKWVKGKWDNNSRTYGKASKIKQVRTEPADLANTILKMAKKRALIDGVLTTTAASDIFTQDIEDLPAEYVASQEQETRPQESVILVSDDQIAKIRQALLTAGKHEDALCKKCRVVSISEIEAARFDAVIELIGPAFISNDDVPF